MGFVNIKPEVIKIVKRPYQAVKNIGNLLVIYLAQRAVFLALLQY
jgi:hypothetical protein